MDVIVHELPDVVLAPNETDAADTVMTPDEVNAAVVDKAPDVEPMLTVVPAVTAADRVIPVLPVMERAVPDDIAADTEIVGEITVRAFLKVVAPLKAAVVAARTEKRASVAADRSRAPMVAAVTRLEPSCNVPDVVIVANSVASKIPPVPNVNAPDELRSNKTFAEPADKIKPEAIWTSAPDNDTVAMEATVMLAVALNLSAPDPIPPLSAWMANVEAAPVTRTGAERSTSVAADHVAGPVNHRLPGNAV